MSEQQLRVWVNTALRVGVRLCAELMRAQGIPFDQAKAVLVRVPKERRWIARDRVENGS